MQIEIECLYIMLPWVLSHSHKHLSRSLKQKNEKNLYAGKQSSQASSFVSPPMQQQDNQWSNKCLQDTNHMSVSTVKWLWMVVHLCPGKLVH